MELWIDELLRKIFLLISFFLLKNCSNKTWYFFLLLITYYQLVKIFVEIFLTVASLTPAELCVEYDGGFLLTSIPIGHRG